MSAYGNSRILEGITTAAANSGYHSHHHSPPWITCGDQSSPARESTERSLPLDKCNRDYGTKFHRLASVQMHPTAYLWCLFARTGKPLLTIDSDSYGFATATVDFLSEGHKTGMCHRRPPPPFHAQHRAASEVARRISASPGIPPPMYLHGDWEADMALPSQIGLSSRLHLQFSRAAIKWHTVPCL